MIAPPAVSKSSTTDRASNDHGIIMESGRITRVASVTVILFIVLAACKLGQALIEPVVFAVFIIEIAWPLQKSPSPWSWRCLV